MISTLARDRTTTSALATRGLLVILALFAIGLGIRLFDLTDQPLDFHPTRQLRSAVIARGMYYQMLPGADPDIRRQAITFWKSTGQYEPSILERLVAWTYLLLGGEKLWVVRVYTILFWLAGGAVLFALARRMLDEASPGGAGSGSFLGAALVALAYYLILPFGVQASRSFQPDPGMILGMLLAVYGLFRWSETPNWKWALFAGLAAGLTVLVKVVAIYSLALAAAALVLYTLGPRRFWRNPQVWAMAVVMVAPSLLYVRTGPQVSASEYLDTWTISLSRLLIEPSFYIRWLNFVQSLVGFTPLLLALLGVLISPPRGRALLAGLWVGYGLYGMLNPYQIHTHSYYHLRLVPLVALSLAPLARLALQQIAVQPRGWRALAVAVALAGLAYPAWVSYDTFNKQDFRSQPAYWQAISRSLPGDGKILALTQDYGYYLMYYGWRKVTLWPISSELYVAGLRGEQKDFSRFFAKRVAGKDYFLITDFEEYDRQPDLKQALTKGYPVTNEDGYLLYDLAHPLPDGSSTQ